MRKQFDLVRRRAALTVEEFTSSFVAALAGADVVRAADGGIRRVVVGRVLEPRPDVERPFDALVETWVDDQTDLAVWGEPFGEWLRTDVSDLVDGPASLSLCVKELPLRGADYLARRFASRDPARVVKSYSFSHRADGLTLTEFSQLWRTHHGPLAGQRMPPAVQGFAYVQNHALPVQSGEPAFDGVAEIYLQDVETYRRRLEWFNSQDAADLNREEKNLASKAGRVMLLTDEQVARPR